jgi:hypothetical protein
MYSSRQAIPIIVMFLLAGISARPSVVMAEADDGHAAARVLAQEGAEFYDKGAFPEALDRFKQAYARFPSPKLLFNIGQTLRALSRNVEAVAAFDRFLAEAKDASPQHTEQATAQRSELLSLLGRISVVCDQGGGLLRIDGEDRGPLSLPSPIAVEPGMHQVTVVWGTRQKSVNILAVAGQITTVTVDSKNEAAEQAPSEVPATAMPTVAAATAAKPKDEGRSFLRGHGWYWIASGATAIASLGAGVAFSIRTHTLSERVSNASSWSSSDYSAGQQAEKLQWVFYGIAAGAAGLTVLLYEVSPRSTVVAPVAAPGAWGLAARGVF